jgi:hypothetical protein
MTLGHGPKIITKGLVFAYDMGPNPGANKSWKGAPTFNASLQNGQNDVSPWGGDGTPTSLGIDSSVKFRGRKVAKFQTGSSGNCYINGAGDLSTGTTSTVWTTTIYLKRVDNTPLTSVTMYQYITNNTNVNAAQTLTLVEDGWYKAVYTRSGLSAGYPSLTGMTGLGAGNQYYFADWQCENNLYSTPWVSGTRSNTQALVDLTGNNTITANSLTYNSDGTFSFNGSSDYITIPNTTLGNGNIPWTVSAWMKTTTTTNTLGQGSILSNSSGGPVYSMMGVNNGKIVYWTYQNSAWTQKLGIGKTVNDGNWHMLTWVNYNNYTMDMYADGLLDSNVPNSTSGNNNPVDRIGGSWTARFPGSISALSRYDRALTAPEVTQNFNALRGRYGI